MSFCDKDFLLSNDVARELYHDTAAGQPILDYHCHLPPKDLAEKLEDLEMRWWNITFHIYDIEQLKDPELLGLRRVMLGAARRWRNFLSDYAARLRSYDKVVAPSRSSLAEAERAQEMRARARKYVR